MLHKIISDLDKKVHFESVDAHCDIPCGIYDPHQAQIGALTVIRMIDLIHYHVEEAEKMGRGEFYNNIARYIAVKEEHAELTKHEIRVIWGDFIKSAHIEKYPQLHELVHKIMGLGSKVRQTIDRETAMAFLDAVNEFAEIFWQIKDIPTKRVKAPYAISEEIAVPMIL